MLFHTWTFAAFFLIVYAVYLPTRGTRFCVYWLWAASYVFYGWWNWSYLALIVYSTLIDFFCVRRMAAGGRRRLWLVISLVANLGLLGFFKYSTFLVKNVNRALALAGVTGGLPLPQEILPEGWQFVLPVGISFFVFQSLSYTIDFYRGNVPCEPSFIRYTTFVSFFPQLVAGPIERAKNLLGQLYGRREITGRHIADGMSLFLVGFFKKVAIADYLASYVDQVYAVPQLYNGAALAMATFAFAWQIYCDFSGYTDMARGIARAMGFNLMLNFNNPYLASGLGEFWQRWHISLSTWFRDYVYIPLGGNRGGPWRTYANMFVTMMISAVWHGAAWTFIFWGLLHGVGRLLTRRLEESSVYKERVPRFARQMLVFAFVCVTWVFFRATSLHDALTVLARMVTTPLTDPQFPLMGYALCLGLWGYEFAFESRLRPLLESGVVRLLTALGMIIYLAVFTSSRSQAFIYFQF
ncbi:MAG TPA: MBOAT family O-acyltransferase [Verrucomicrobiae bacterium]|nr:MBOAT family O-acyltransferase [Verrucomicrobiae bacterium]